MNVDILYLAWNRKEFTELSFDMLLKNTEWEKVDRLFVYDDGSTDGTKKMLYEKIHQTPVEYHLVETPQIGPVGVMNHYVGHNSSWAFAKIDNDIVVPEGWLGRLIQVMEDSDVRDPYVNSTGQLEALGMEAGRAGDRCTEAGFEEARWIGGVGLIRTAAIGGRPLMKPNGRYGWTEFQTEYSLRCGWVCPDLLLCSLDQVPLEPWRSYAAKYVENEWSRQWPEYHERWMEKYWGWWQ